MKVSKTVDYLFAINKDEIDEVNEILINCVKPLFSKELLALAKKVLNSGGKRLRPILAISVAKALGIEDKKYIHIAAAVELIHNATLLHDDVIDNADKRRGLKTINNIYGNKTAILLGDHIFSHSFIEMVKCSSIDALVELSNTSKIITEGELLQLHSTNNPDITFADILNIIKAKTASLFACACQVPAIIGNESDEIIKEMYNFGLNFGLIFQISDDIMDIHSSFKIMGKNPGGDLREGKLNFFTKIAMDHLDKENKKILQNIIKDPIKNENKIDHIISVMKNDNILLHVNKYFDEYCEKAVQSLGILPNSEIKNQLIELCYEQRNRIK